MSSTLVLIALMVSLSVAVVFPELQYSKVNKSISILKGKPKIKNFLKYRLL